MSERPRLPVSFLKQFKRERLMEAAASVIARKGYNDTIVSDLVSEAKVARNTFYETFSSKEDCFQSTVRWIVEQATDRIETQVNGYTDINERIEAGMEALVEFVREYPHWTTCCLIEAPAGAPELYQEMLERAAERSGLPAPVNEMVVGGVAFILYRYALVGGDGDEQELLKGLKEFAQNSFAAVELQTR
jgi:AcrR family transcriptional regulator